MSREELIRLIGQIAEVVITAEDAQDCVLEICSRLKVRANGDLRQLTRPPHEGSASSEGPDPDALDAEIGQANTESEIGQAIHTVLDLVGRRAARITNQNRMNDVARALGWRVDFATGSPITWDKVLTEVARRHRPETRDPVASAMEAWACELDAADPSPHAAGRFLAAEIRRRIAASSPVDVTREVERDA